MQLLSSTFFCVVTTPRPPSYTLFPYTTLFRSLAARRNGLAEVERIRGLVSGRQASGMASRYDVARADAEASLAALARSEEHTSELQSLRHLVCRLLLEKKKNKNKNNRTNNTTR